MKTVAAFAALATIGTMAACGLPGELAAPREYGGTPSLNIINNNIDLVGTPDLIVRRDVLQQEWLIRDENLSATACSVVEGGVEPGVRRLLRMTVMTPNVGDADIFIGDPNTYFVGGQSDLYEFAECHGHYHFKNYALYELVEKNSDGSDKRVWRAAKRGFCMLDTDPNPAWMGEPARDQNFLNCGSTRSAGNQGVSHGWADTYRWFLGGQYFVLDGNGGKQDPVPPGTYYIRVTVNPAYTVEGACPRATESTNGSTSVCHQFQESNYGNNTVEVAVDIPLHVGRSGYGPLKGAVENTKDPKYEAAR